MATYRIGIGSFNLKDNAVGIGTESAGLGNLKVEGTIKTTDLDVTGVSTFTRYAGFAADDINIIDVTLTGEHSTQGDIVVGVNSIFTVSTGATVTVGTVPSVSIGTHFSPPTGGGEERPEVPVEGTVRFNKDLNTLEFYNGVEWRQFTVNGARGRGLFAAGYDGELEVETDMITYVEVSTLGNALDFGLLNANGTGSRRGGCSNGIRGLAGGAAPNNDYIDMVTIASTGNSADFGNLSVGRYHVTSCSSSTRGIFAGGTTQPSPGARDVIDYVEIATTGNAIDFGNTTSSEATLTAAANPIRGFCFGTGSTAANGYGSNIDMITFSTLGNAIDFAECAFGIARASAGSNTVRALVAGRQGPSTAYRGEVIQRFTMASGGNTESFGELTTSRSPGEGSATNATRSVWGGGFTDPSAANMVTVIDYKQFESSGDAVSFGDMGVKRDFYAAINDTHGGLGGY